MAQKKNSPKKPKERTFIIRKPESKHIVAIELLRERFGLKAVSQVFLRAAVELVELQDKHKAEMHAYGNLRQKYIGLVMACRDRESSIETMKAAAEENLNELYY